MLRIDDFENPFSAFYALGAHLPAPSVPTPEPKATSVVDACDFCVIDTETSGLAARDVAVQVAIVFFDANGRQIGVYDRIWTLPDGVRIGRRAFAVHRINTAKIRAEGFAAREELPRVHRMLKRVLARGKLVVAHNAAFDCRMLKQTAAAHGFCGWNVSRSDIFCTMQSAKDRCGLTTAAGKAKSPTNAELYRFLVGEAPTGNLHDAKVDCGVTGKSFAAGVKRGWW